MKNLFLSIFINYWDIELFLNLFKNQFKFYKVSFEYNILKQNIPFWKHSKYVGKEIQFPEYP